MERMKMKVWARACKLLSWWNKKWPASGDLQSRVQKEKERIPKTEPDKDPDEAGEKPDTTCVGELDRTTKTKEQLGGPHISRNIKYGSEDLPGMSTKVSTVKGTTGGKVQTVEALAGSGASEARLDKTGDEEN